jgi:hypothetical protein
MLLRPAGPTYIGRKVSHGPKKGNRLRTARVSTARAAGAGGSDVGSMQQTTLPELSTNVVDGCLFIASS